MRYCEQLPARRGWVSTPSTPTLHGCVRSSQPRTDATEPSSDISRISSTNNLHAVFELLMRGIQP